MIKRELLETQLVSLQEQEAQYLNDAMAARGAIQFCQHLIKLAANEEKATQAAATEAPRLKKSRKLNVMPRPPATDESPAPAAG